MTTVSYRRPLTEVKTVAKAMGNLNMSNRDVGMRTFDYYVKNEIVDED